MDATRRTLTLRRVATMAALAALTVPAGSAEAATKHVKPPVITAVSPMKVTAGHWLRIDGRNFRRGKGRNSVGFKRDGAAVVFARSDISTAKMLKVRVPVKLENLLYSKGADKVATRFHLRILTSRFGKAFTPNRLSPLVSARPDAPGGGDGGGLGANPGPTTPPAPSAEGDCDGDGVLNRNDPDDDNDFFSDADENRVGTDGCKADSDGDGIIDGYEFRSAVDLNDDEYQQPNTALPYPGKRPYPNPLDKSDADKDFDGDGLTLSDEYALWKYTTPNPKLGAFNDVPGGVVATPLSYSDGLKYSVSEYQAGRRVPALAAANYDKWNGPDGFWTWAQAHGYDTVMLHEPWNPTAWYAPGGRHSYDIRNVDLSTLTPGVDQDYEAYTIDRNSDAFLSDDERDEDADGLSNLDEIRGRMLPEYWTSCYAAEAPELVPFSKTNAVDADSDNDTIRDGADDEDHDDYPNLMELSRKAASGIYPTGHALAGMPQFDDTDDGVKESKTGGGQDCKPDPDLKPDVPRHPNPKPDPNNPDPVTKNYGQVNPFNRCLPDPRSRSCPTSIPFGAELPGSGPNWWALN